MLNLDDMYRATFDINANGFNAEVEREMKKPSMEEIFGHDSASAAEEASEDQKSVQEPPKKKKKAKVILVLFSLIISIVI